MKKMNLMARATVVAVASVWFSGSALAFTCGMVSASATSKNEQRAISQANAIGQKQTNKLDQKYGSSIQYQTAKVACSSKGSGVFCKITQRYCIDDDNGQDEPPDFGGDGVDPNTPQCLKWQRQCNNGKNSACGKYEGNCQND
jgi:hypothetical protein